MTKGVLVRNHDRGARAFINISHHPPTFRAVHQIELLHGPPADHFTVSCEHDQGRELPFHLNCDPRAKRGRKQDTWHAIVPEEDGINDKVHRAITRPSRCFAQVQTSWGI